MANNEVSLSAEIKDLLDKVEDKSCKEYVDGLYTLMCAYEAEGHLSKAFGVANEFKRRYVEDDEFVTEKMIRTAYDVCARAGDFESYCIALEWNRPVMKKFYIPRAKLLKKHGVMKLFQDLQDDLLDLAVLNLPPRIGKSTISLFFITFRAGLYPDMSILGNGHSTALTQAFYKEFLDIVTSDEYRYKEIFPSVQLVTKNSEYSFVDFNRDKRFHTCMFKSIDGGTTGLAEASNLLYCDDLVKDVETANSKDRLDKLYYNYTSTVKDRKVPRLCKDGVYRPCPELHVNTPWSIYDVTSRIIKTEIEKGNNERMRVVSIPCWDEFHQSNFLYDFGKGFDVDYYEDMMIAEDPVIFSAKYLMKPIEREGHPFERDALTYYTDLPVGTPDVIIAYNDVAHGGEDFMSMPVGYVYGRDVFIEDVLFIHNFDGDSVSRPLVCEMLKRHSVTRCGFEKNNGGDFYSTLISQDLRADGYRCNITAYNAPTNRSKLDRILSCQNEIKGVGGLDGSYRFFFKEPRMVNKNSQYMMFLENMWTWSQKEGAIQKKQHDDSVDSLASMMINMLGNFRGGGVKLYDIREAGY